MLIVILKIFILFLSSKLQYLLIFHVKIYNWDIKINKLFLIIKIFIMVIFCLDKIIFLPFINHQIKGKAFQHYLIINMLQIMDVNYQNSI